MARYFFTAILAIAFALVSIPAWAQPKAEHVFIISFDGGKPSVMQKCAMPTTFNLIKEGSCSWGARTIYPSTTLPSHTSMLTGVGPAKHKVLWNDWDATKVAKISTIFKMAKKNGLMTAMFVGKPKFKHLSLPGSLDHFSLPSYKSSKVAAAAADYIVKKKPNLCFIHFADSDGAGHAHGWGSQQQMKSFADEDAALKTVLSAINRASIASSSVVILTADHGGHDRTHGTDSPEDMIIPWIVWGNGVKRGYSITEPITTYDTAATALWLLDLKLPKEFDGKPVTSAFNQSEMAQQPE